MLGASSAIAAPMSLPFSVTPGGPAAPNWDLDNLGGTDSGLAFSGSSDGTAGFNINDAQSGGDSDAYDNAYSIWVDDVIFDAPDPVDLTGNTVTAGPVVLSGLNVTMEYAFSDVVAAGRIRTIFQNPTGAPINISVGTAMNFGSDGSTTIEATSSGDLLFTTADRWVVTSDTGPGDPVNTTVLYGPGAVVTPSFADTTVFDDAGPEGIASTFDITVPANSTRQLMFFAGMGDVVGPNNTIAGAVANASTFDDNATIDASLLAGIPAGDLGEIINWALAAAAAGGGGRCSLGPTTASAWTAGDLWLMLALISCLGLWRVRRRIDQ